MNITVFWDVIQYSLADMYQHFGGTCFFHLEDTGVKMKAAYSFETMIPTYRTTQCHIPEDSKLTAVKTSNFTSNTYILGSEVSNPADCR
jgi:hypothetical protein